MKPIVIGRSASCDMQVDAPDVSAVHCEVSASHRGIVVRDLSSTNGTQVNGVLISDGVVTRSSILSVGNTALTLTLEEEKWLDARESHFGDLVGQSEAMKLVFRMLSEAAPTELSVLLTGETGTGKEVAARCLHQASARRDKPFVVLDCTSVPASLAESILFGHEKGAFTGATERTPGLFQEASGGTLFLDEIGELPTELQPKLLRALAEKQVKRVGANRYESVDVRVVAATLRDLSQSINHGHFRSDVYFRLAQLRIRLPPLRDRLDDLPLLVEQFCQRLGLPNRSADVVAFIRQNCSESQWKGNVRELANVVQLVASVAPGSPVLEQLVQTHPYRLEEESGVSDFTTARREVLREFERSYFEKLAERCDGNVSEMARQSGIGRHYVRGHLKRHGISVGRRNSAT
jgi:DNA-binding NtrC family response regulator